jgi:acyl-CoA synthetase (AMP-forming)/AMP-acid ligase II
MANSAEVVTYAQLEARSNQLAHLLFERGLRRGDHMAVLVENHPRYFEVLWAALRSGIYVTPINWHLGHEEAGYIISDCGARALVTTAKFAHLASLLEPYLERVATRLSIGGEIEGFELYEDAISAHPTTPLDMEFSGAVMFYSSGTTGRPKGIKPPLSQDPFGSPGGLGILLEHVYGFSAESRYLVPAPLYHAAPTVWSVAAQRLGSTIVVMEQFDAETALRDIETYAITHAQFVPTHFVRMLKLAPDVRERYDLSSLQMVVHAAAPCPVEVKRQMLEWFGPKIWEYYAGSEGNGYVSASPQDWLDHPGTVGRILGGAVHVLDEEGNELSNGEVGQIWFDNGAVFEYHNDPDKTKGAFNHAGWSTLGDIGYVDDEGFVFLTDRASHMIISGGVNVYPQEVENLLVMHPAIADVAVIGVPDEDLGEVVKAVVQLQVGQKPSGELAAELIEYCRMHLAKFKCPRTVDFVDELPRLPSGKLMKRVLIDQYKK